MKNLLFLLFLSISSITFSQSVVQKDTMSLAFAMDSSYTPCVMTINYWEYMSGKPYYHYSPRNLNPTIRIGFNKKKLYICNDKYFYYTERGRKYKFIF